MSIKGIFPIDKWDFKSESVFKDLPADDLALLTAHKTEQVYKKGEIIFREAAFPSGIFYISEGKAKKYKLEGSSLLIHKKKVYSGITRKDIKR